MRFVVLLLCAALALSSLMGMARVVGYGQPSQLWELFTMPDGTPCQPLCLFGVTPAKTMPDEAVQLLRAHPLTRHLSQVSASPFRLEGQSANRIVMVSFNTTADGVVDEITLSTYVRYTLPPEAVPMAVPNGGVLGDLVSMFGTPNFVHLTTGTDPTLAYLNQRLLASLIRSQTVDRHLTPQMPISRLTLFRYDACPTNAFIYVFLKWRGMAHIWRYGRGQTVQRYVRRMASQGATFAPCG